MCKSWYILGFHSTDKHNIGATMNYIKMVHAIKQLETKEAKAEQDIIDLKADVEKLKTEKP